METLLASNGNQIGEAMFKKLGFYMILLSMILIFIMFGFGCMKSRTYYNNDDQIADNIITTIINAIAEKNVEKIKSLYSQEIAASEVTLVQDIQALFAMCDGIDYSYSDRAGSNSEGWHYGHHYLELKYTYVVTIDNEQFLFFFIDQQQNTEAPETEGLQLLQVMRLENKDIYFDWGYTRWTGIHLPDYQEECNDN